MGETSDGPPAAGQRVSDDGDPDSPARSTFFSRLFRREAPETGHSEQEPGDSDASRAASSDGEIMVNLRNLRRMRVDDVSVPRADIVAVSEDSTIEDLVSVFQNSTLSRLPVYAESLDQPKGLVHLKDLALNYGFGATKRPFALAPLIRREIHYRLLAGEAGWRLRQIATVDTQSHQVARAIASLNTRFAEPLRMETLAREVGMSLTTFHHHFKSLTAMSPLQYQKWLRLNEARRLMLSDGAEAATAAFSVGYESPSQFSREYARLFGAPPRRDVAALKPPTGLPGARGRQWVAHADRRRAPRGVAEPGNENAQPIEVGR